MNVSADNVLCSFTSCCTRDLEANSEPQRLPFNTRNGPSSVDFGHPLQTHELCPNGFASPPDEEVVYIYIIF
jgi:hypothetical protein